MSAIACIREGRAGTIETVKEYMSGNLCRCGAYPNITAAILEVQKAGGVS
jgi:xanthine dehydrogenase YagT iron-sulfur-binding subunit